MKGDNYEKIKTADKKRDGNGWVNLKRMKKDLVGGEDSWSSVILFCQLHIIKVRGIYIVV
jgi:hypothetical protein